MRTGATRFPRTVLVGAGLLGCLLLSSLLFGWADPDRERAASQAGIAAVAQSRQPANITAQQAPAPTPETTLDPAPAPTRETTLDPAPASTPGSLTVVATKPNGDPASVLAPPVSIAAEDEVSPEPVVQDEISLWLKIADQRIRQDRLSFPRGESARDYIRKVLARDPDNGQALSALDRVADRYAELAQKRMDRGDYKKARRLVGHGLAARPERTDLKRLQRALEQPKPAIAAPPKETAATQVRTPAKRIRPIRRQATDLRLFNQEHGS